MSPHAFVTCLFGNDSYVPGALVLAHALRRCATTADTVCLVAAGVTARRREQLGLVFDAVVQVPLVALEQCSDQRRQYVRHVLTRISALRLGSDGDLGCQYEKIVLLDADVLPLRCYDHLFLVDNPGGILNERSDHLKTVNTDGTYAYDPTDVVHGRWRWHDVYQSIPHGALIPDEITRRVEHDPHNYGVNTAVLVLSPSMDEYRSIIRQLTSDRHTHALLARFNWPDMQYLTLRWSGRWHNVDACFAGLCGYPDLSVLFGTHFAGPKPWQIANPTVTSRFSRFADFRRWYAEFVDLAESHPWVRNDRRLRQLLGHSLQWTPRKSGGRVDWRLQHV